ncbi:MAG: hypothetical protein RL122_1312 [Pseudomonadota bacterium]
MPDTTAKASVRKRERSVTLDALKVRQLAASRGMKGLPAFEREFIRHIAQPSDITTEPTTPKNAWNGIKLDKNKAMTLAEFLGLSNYEALLPPIFPELIYPTPLQWNAHYSPPGALLKAEYAIVPFHQREQELNDLMTWCLDDNPVAVRLYTGAGGMGKTRLASEQCQQLKKQYHWATGFLRHGTTEGEGQKRFDWLAMLETPAFIVIDYAETRRNEVLMLLAAALRVNTKVRVVLLARAAADWWSILKQAGQSVGDLLMGQATSWIVLRPLFLRLRDREESFLLASKHFAQRLQCDPALDMPADIQAEHFERVLLLHMQALINVDGKQASQGLQSILEVILNRERHFWERQAYEQMLPKSLHKAIGTAMAKITLIGGVPDKQSAERILSNIPLLMESKYHERRAIIDLLHGIYPCHQATAVDENQPCNYIEPLQPDLLGEYLIQEELMNDPDTILDCI